MNKHSSGSDSDNDRRMRSNTQLSSPISGDGMTTREKIASSVGLFVPSPRLLDDAAPSDAAVSKEGVRTRRMSKKLEEMERERTLQRDVSTSSFDAGPLYRGPTTAEGIDQTPSTPSTPPSQIMTHESPIEAPGAPRKTRLMRIDPEDWTFGMHIARRLDLFDEENNLQRRASATSDNDSFTD